MYVVPVFVETATQHATDVSISLRADAGDGLTANPHVLAGETSSVSATSTSTSDAPFFTSGSIASGSDSGEESNVTKTALEWVFAIAALLTLASVTTWRYAQIRRNNQSMRSFIPRRRTQRSGSTDRILDTRERRRSLPRTTGLPRVRTLSSETSPVMASLFYPPSLVHGRYPEPLEPAPAHLAHSASIRGLNRGTTERRGRRAVRGADTDLYGRRGGLRDSDDLDGDDKDELPAYESVAIGGPPRYADGDLHVVGGVPMHILTLPMPTLASNPDATELDRERMIEQAFQREADEQTTREPPSSSSSDRHCLLENARSANVL